MARFTFEAPAELARFIAEKGSVSLDGTSLHRERRRWQPLRRDDHPAHARCHDLGRAARGRSRQPRGRHARALRCAAEARGNRWSGSREISVPKAERPLPSARSSRRASTTTSPTSFCRRDRRARKGGRDLRADHRPGRAGNSARAGDGAGVSRRNSTAMCARLRHPRRDHALRHRRQRIGARTDGSRRHAQACRRQRHPDRRERRAGLGARARQRNEQGRRRGGGGARDGRAARRRSPRREAG